MVHRSGFPSAANAFAGSSPLPSAIGAADGVVFAMGELTLNRIGMPCFYAALSLETAWLEAQQGFAFKSQPLTICTYQAQFDDVLDLCDPDVREATLVSLRQLNCAWERLAGDRKPVPTWELADRLIAGGCAGVIVPSFASRSTPEDRNLVLWSWSRKPPHCLQVIDDDQRLPRDQSSWHDDLKPI